MKLPPQLKPLPAKQFNQDCARHLLNRAGFGGTPAQVRALAGMGLQGAVEALVDYQDRPYADAAAQDFDPDIMVPLTQQEQQALAQARRSGDQETLQKYERERNRRQAADREQIREMRKWWLRRMIESPRPLEEKMTLFWHGHFANGYRTVEESWNMFQQNQLFREHATGNFARLVRKVIRDPSMIKYLDNDQNRRGSPNENLSRELMELFTLGEGRGYTEQDIKEGARALTGLTFRDNQPFFNQGAHDTGRKTIFGYSGSFDADGFVDLILAKPECPRFICEKLYRFFVNDAPEGFTRTQEAFIQAAADHFVQQKGELKPLLKAVFASEHFHHPGNRGAIIKSPVQLVVQAARQFHTPVRSLSVLASACELMGQNLFEPPNVKGWDGGRAWINTSTLFTRQNLMVYLLTGRTPRDQAWEASDQGYSALHLVDAVRGAGDRVDPPQGVDWLMRCSLATPPEAARTATILQSLTVRGMGMDNHGIIEALCLITALPEYQLC